MVFVITVLYRTQIVVKPRIQTSRFKTLVLKSMYMYVHLIETSVSVYVHIHSPNTESDVYIISQNGVIMSKTGQILRTQIWPIVKLFKQY